MSDEQPIAEVIFRRWRWSISPWKSVFAIFPYLASTSIENTGECTFYEHVGQHSGGHYLIAIDKSTPASTDEPDVADLKAELEGRGYRLKVVRRKNWGRKMM